MGPKDRPPSPHRTNSFSPPRYPRHPRSDSRDVNYYDRDDEQRDRDTYRRRERSRSPGARRSSHISSASRSDIPERYDPAASKIPNWNNYRPDYEAQGRRPSELISPIKPKSISPARKHPPSPLRQNEVTSRPIMPEVQKPSAKLGGVRPKSASTPPVTNDARKPPPAEGMQISATSPPVSPMDVQYPTPTSAVEPREVTPVTNQVATKSTQMVDIQMALAKETSVLVKIKSALKIAEVHLHKRTAEFDKWKPHHEKFPDLKNEHLREKKDAETAAQRLKAQVKEQDTKVKMLGARLENSVAAILAQTRDESQASRLEDEKLQNITKIQEGFKKLLEAQNALILELQNDKVEKDKKLEAQHATILELRSDNLETNKKLQAQQESMQAQLARQESVELQVTRLSDENKNLEPSILEVINSASSEAKRSAVGLEERVKTMEAKSKKHGNDIASLSARTSDINSIRESMKLLTDVQATVSTQNASFTARHEDLNKKVVELVRNSQETSKTLENRLKAVELLPSTSTFDGRICKLESMMSSKTTIKADDATVSRLSDIERAHENLVTKVNAISDKVQASENSLESLQDAQDTMQETIGQTINKGIDQFEVDIDARFTAMQKQIQRSQTDIKQIDSKISDKPVQMDNNSVQTVQMEKMESKISDNMVQIGNNILAQIESKVSNKMDNEILNKIVQMDKKFSAQIDSTISSKMIEVDNKNSVQMAQMDSKISNFNDIISNRLNHLTNTFNAESNKTRNDLDALFHTVENLSRRMDTINTRELAQYMLSQLAVVYPNLENTDAALKKFRDELTILSRDIQTLFGAQQAQNTPNIGLFQQQLAALSSQVHNIFSSWEVKTSEFKAEIRGEIEKDSKLVADQLGDIVDRFARVEARLTTQEKESPKLKKDPVLVSATSSMANPSATSSKPASHSRTSSTASGVSSWQGSVVTKSVLPVPSKPRSISHAATNKSTPTQQQQQLKDSTSQSGTRESGSTQQQQQTKKPASSIVVRSLKRRHQSAGSNSNTPSGNMTVTPQRKRSRPTVTDSDEDDGGDSDPEDEIPQPRLVDDANSDGD